MAGINDVRYYDSQMTGSPGPGLYAAGRLIAVLDACLVNGFNVNAVTQIVVANGIATATTSVDHNFRDYTVLRVAGATEAALNGDWKCTVPSGTTFTWPTSAPAGTYTGTLSAKTAPLGWSKDFSGTNIAVYRAPSGLRHYFRVNDAAASWAYVRGYEVMTGSGDAGTQPFPTATQMATGDYWIKADTAAYTNRWVLAGDERAVFIVLSGCDHNGVLSGSNSDYLIQGFGEFVSYVPNDIGASFVAGSNSASGPYGHSNGINWPGYVNGANYTYGGFYVDRPASQITGFPDRLRAAGSGLVMGWGSSYWAEGRMPTPNPADNAMVFHYPVLLQEETSKAIRGEIPGLWQPLTTGSAAPAGNTYDVNGRKILMLRGPDSSNPSTSSTNRSGLVGIDITGPWR